MSVRDPHRLPPLPKSLSMRQRIQALEAIVTHAAREMDIQTCLPLRIQIADTASSNPFEFASTLHKVIIPTIYLLEKEEIPSSLLIADTDDPRLQDQGYYHQVKDYIVEKLKSSGIPLKSMKETEIVEAPINLVAAMKIIQDNDSKEHKNLEFVIRHELAHIKLGHHGRQAFLQIGGDLFVLFVFIALTIYLPLHIALSLPCALFVSIVAEKFITTIVTPYWKTISPALARAKEFAADKLAVKGRPDLIKGGVHRLQAKLAKQEMLCKLPLVGDIYLERYKPNGSPISSSQDTHPSEKKRIKKLMKLLDQN